MNMHENHVVNLISAKVDKTIIDCEIVVLHMLAEIQGITSSNGGNISYYEHYSFQAERLNGIRSAINDAKRNI